MKPSPAQRTAYLKLRPGPLVLFCQFRAADEAKARAIGDALVKSAKPFGGSLRYRGSEEQVLCGKTALYHQAASFHFTTRDGALGWIDAETDRGTLASVPQLQVAVLARQPAAIGAVSWVLSRVAPRWPFDNTVEQGEEPGIGTSVMPSAETIASIRSNPDQDTPVTMVNWLKFKPRATYAPGVKEPPRSGGAAYRLYGKVALLATHSLGAKLIYASRYLMMLVGNGGDPGRGLWDEFALMQYPGRRTFGQMAQLRRYRAGLHHRAAGLAENGQGLTLTKPAQEFTWRR